MDNCLSHEQLRSFQTDGFLAIDNVLNDDDLHPIEDEYQKLLDEVIARLFATGYLPETVENLPFGDKFSKAIAHYPDLHRFLNISLPLVNGEIDSEIFHLHAGPAVFDILRHPKILNLVEAIVGPEIYSSPVQQMRMKPPLAAVNKDLQGHSNVGATTWHQDIVALLPAADETEQLTVWLAITEATVENGCLASVPGSHREGPKTHCANDSIASEPQVPGKLLDGRPIVPLPVQRGGVVLFHKMNIHCALPNNSVKMRWSMDLRYHPTGQATGRHAFPGFVARSRAKPETELKDPKTWATNWDLARKDIVSGQFQGRIFEDERWNDEVVC